MKIAVTGAAGFIGSHVAEALLVQGHEVIGIDCFTDYYDRSVKAANLRRALASTSFEFYEIDLRREPLERVLNGVQAVINEAAMPGLPRSWSNFDEYASCNLLAVQRLVEACSSVGIERFIQASTSSVYGTEAMGREDVAARPVSPYGVTKLAAENLLLAHAATFGFPAVILRYFSIYGPRQRPDMAYNIFIESLIRGKEIVVYGDGQQSRTNTFVDDCVRGTLQALAEAEVGEIYNLGGGESVTLLEAIQLISDLLDVKAQIRFESQRPGDQRHTRADISKASKAFGYYPRVAPAQGLAEQIAWQTRRHLAE